MKDVARLLVDIADRTAVQRDRAAISLELLAHLRWASAVPEQTE